MTYARRNLPSNYLPIGLFDSGIGGLSVVQELQQLLPEEELCYFADQAHFPYGEKNAEQLICYSRSAAAFLMEKGIKLLVIACHTASAYALHALQRQLSIPVIGMIEPTLRILQKERSIVLLGTAALIRSNLYQERIRKEYPHLTVNALIGQQLVTAVEEGRPDDASLIAQKLLKGQQFEALLLGCTHFARIKPILQQVIGPDLPILDPAKSVAKAVAEELTQSGLLNPSCSIGNIHYYTHST